MRPFPEIRSITNLKRTLRKLAAESPEGNAPQTQTRTPPTVETKEQGFDWTPPAGHRFAPLNFDSVPKQFQNVIKRMCSVHQHHRPTALQVFERLKVILSKLQEEHEESSFSSAMGVFYQQEHHTDDSILADEQTGEGEPKPSTQSRDDSSQHSCSDSSTDSDYLEAGNSSDVDAEYASGDFSVSDEERHTRKTASSKMADELGVKQSSENEYSDGFALDGISKSDERDSSRAFSTREDTKLEEPTKVEESGVALPEGVSAVDKHEYSHALSLSKNTPREDSVEHFRAGDRLSPRSEAQDSALVGPNKLEVKHVSTREDSRPLPESVSESDDHDYSSATLISTTSLSEKRKKRKKSTVGDIISSGVFGSAHTSFRTD